MENEGMEGDVEAGADDAKEGIEIGALLLESIL
jgi:hypothetical protein